MSQVPAPRGGEKWWLETPVQDTGTICQPGLVPQLFSLPGAQVQDFKGLPFPQAVTLCCSSMQAPHTTGVTVHVSRRTPEFWWWGRKDPAGEGEKPRDSRQVLDVNSCCHSWGFWGPRNLWRKRSGKQGERQCAKRAPLTLPHCPDRGSELGTSGEAPPHSQLPFCLLFAWCCCGVCLFI